MKLNEICSVPRSDNDLILEFIKDIETNSVFESALLEANIKSLIAGKAQKLKGLLSKVKNPANALNELQGKIWVKFQQLGLEQGHKKKVIDFAKKHAKLVKPALMLAIIGASIFGMDAAHASDLVNSLDQMSPDSVQQMAEPFVDAHDAAGGAEQASSPDMEKFTNDFYSKMKNTYDQGHNQVQYNGQTMSFDQVVKYAQQKTGINAKEFIQHIGQQKDMDMNDATKEFFKWLQQRDAHGKSVFKDI